MIVIIDYDMGNVGSIANMIFKVGGKAIITNNISEIESSTKVILPGVGAFDNGMENIRKFNLFEVLNHKALIQKVPVLGICLGMQLLGDSSEEGASSGLGWISSKTVKIPNIYDNVRLKIPHMGWNNVQIKKENKLFLDMPSDPRFYFVHSYHVVCANQKDILSQTQYGIDFTSSLSHENIMGTQFHPEKSHKFGMKLIHNFVHNL